MKNNLKRAFTNNIGLKLLAILFALSLWLVVVNVDDPKQTRTYSAVVTVVNEDSLLSAGKYYDIKDGINTVSFRVTGKRSVMEKLRNSSFTATADMKNLEAGTRVPVEISAKNKNLNDSIEISSKQLYLYVELENRATTKFVVEPDTEGTLSPGVIIESIDIEPGTITVSGREAEVNKIASVSVKIPVDGMNTDITQQLEPVFFDADGQIVDVETAGLEISDTVVDVTVNLESVKTVDISVRTSGVLDENLELASITVDPVTVALKGEPQYLNEITGITIPESVINLSEVKGSFSKIVDITAYLPEGVSLVDSAQSMVTICVNMAGDATNNLTISKDKIEVANLASGLKVEIADENISTQMFGAADVLGSINKEDITAFIDCTGLNAGNHVVVLHFNPVDGITIQNVTVNIVITRESGIGAVTTATPEVTKEPEAEKEPTATPETTKKPESDKEKDNEKELTATPAN